MESETTQAETAQAEVAQVVAAPVVSLKEIRGAAIKRAVAAVEALDAATSAEPEDVDTTTLAQFESLDALRDVVAAFGKKVKAAGASRATLEKADPAGVAEFFTSTGLTRKELAAAAKVSTSVIATVQNEKGDRWSVVTFEAKRALIEQWVKDHAAEIGARQVAEAAEQAAKVQAAAAKATKAAAKAAAKVAPKPAKTKAAAASAPAVKPGRPSVARRQANQKPAPVAATA